MLRLFLTKVNKNNSCASMLDATIIVGCSGATRNYQRGMAIKVNILGYARSHHSSVLHRILSPNSLFCPEIEAISKKKKVFTLISSPNLLFCPEIEAISKKKGPHFDFVSKFTILS